jgi:outer membrane protein insertion porin family
MTGRRRHRLLHVLAAAVVVLAASVTPAGAQAEITPLLGRILADVRIEVGGAVSSDAALLQLVETRVGEPLSMERIRESIDHLIGLGRFEDVRVFVEPSAIRERSVVLRWVLVPVQRIARIDVTGRPAASEDDIRAEIAERVGPQPVTTRLPEIEQALRAWYAERGYRAAAVAARILPGAAPELATLRLEVEAGTRTTIGDVAVRGDGAAAPAAVLAELGLVR